ncbi:hypothetical protein Sjap_019305 [Stephania japonica]|uniref:Uncharacterized protein n=1 Tax=Stephania japonica TaxID=461633 RepID=A0AAP0EYJ7_9MAGN
MQRELIVVHELMLNLLSLFNAEASHLNGNCLIVEDWNAQKKVFLEQTRSAQCPDQEGNQVVCYQDPKTQNSWEEDEDERDDANNNDEYDDASYGKVSTFKFCSGNAHWYANGINLFV